MLINTVTEAQTREVPGGDTAGQRPGVLLLTQHHTDTCALHLWDGEGSQARGPTAQVAHWVGRSQTQGGQPLSSWAACPSRLGSSGGSSGLLKTASGAALQQRLMP